VDFEVRRDDLRQCRIIDSPVPELAHGQARLRIIAFGLSANNVTYGVLGEAMSYWRFFPAEEGWGRIPVWGFAEVAATASDGLEDGARMFGFLPPSTELVVTPGEIDERGFVDAAPHRADLPAVYNRYLRVDADASHDVRYEDQQMLLRPLFITSFLLDDYLADEGFFGAATVVLSSASSKTALAAAFLLAEREGIEVVGLTSPGNRSFVEGTGVYDRVTSYDSVDSLPDVPAVYVDFSGDQAVREAVHRHYGEKLGHSAIVGVTHWERTAAGTDTLAGPQPTFFFAPARVEARSRDWGREALFARVGEAWLRYVEWTSGWLEVRHDRGPEAVERVYLELLEGRTDPRVGHVLAMA
jgi:Protein of unknown function (DUF2855)